MQYTGDLYARFGHDYVKLQANSEDFDNLQKENEALKKEVERLQNLQEIERGKNRVMNVLQKKLKNKRVVVATDNTSFVIQFRTLIEKDRIYDNPIEIEKNVVSTTIHISREAARSLRDLLNALIPVVYE